MSPREAVARAGSALTHPSRPVQGRGGQRLSVVPRAAMRPPRAPFVLLVGGLLVGGLAGLLALNTTLAQGAFTLQDLQQRSSALQDQEQTLAQNVAIDDTPQRLAARATALGMVPSVNPVFIRVSDGAILGRPEPGKAAPKPAPSSATAAKASPAATPSAGTTKAPTAKPRTTPRPTSTGTTTR